VGLRKSTWCGWPGKLEGEGEKRILSHSEEESHYTNSRSREINLLVVCQQKGRGQRGGKKFQGGGGSRILRLERGVGGGHESNKGLEGGKKVLWEAILEERPCF